MSVTALVAASNSASSLSCARCLPTDLPLPRSSPAAPSFPMPPGTAREGRSARLEHEVVPRLEPGLGARAAVGRGAGLAGLVLHHELLLDAEDHVAVQVVRALLEQVGDQRLVAGHVEQEVHVRRAEVADLGLPDELPDRT